MSERGKGERNVAGACCAFFPSLGRSQSLATTAYNVLIRSLHTQKTAPYFFVAPSGRPFKARYSFFSVGFRGETAATTTSRSYVDDDEEFGTLDFRRLVDLHRRVCDGLHLRALRMLANLKFLAHCTGNYLEILSIERRDLDFL